VLLRRKLAVLLATVMMMVLSMPVALAEGKADPKCGQDIFTRNCEGHQIDDGLDQNLGGGQEHIRNPHPDHGGGSG
jgi:hypothetical protein